MFSFVKFKKWYLGFIFIWNFYYSLLLTRSNGSPVKPLWQVQVKLPGVFRQSASSPQALARAHSSTSMQCTSPSPVKPGLHLQRKLAGKLQHSEFSTQREASVGSSHSLISVNIKIHVKLSFYSFIYVCGLNISLRDKEPILKKSVWILGPAVEMKLYSLWPFIFYYCSVLLFFKI